MKDLTINIKEIVKQSSPKYTQKEVEDAVRGHILRFNKWIDELSKKHEAELKQILDEVYNEVEKEFKND